MLALHEDVVFCLHSELRQRRFSLSLSLSLSRARAVSLRLHIGVATVPQCRNTAQDLLLRIQREHVLSSLHKNLSELLAPDATALPFFFPTTQRQSDVAICKSERAQTRRGGGGYSKQKAGGSTGVVCVESAALQSFFP